MATDEKSATSESANDNKRVVSPDSEPRSNTENMLLYVATLKDLLRARNRSLLRVLFERNQLLREW